MSANSETPQSGETLVAEHEAWCVERMRHITPEALTITDEEVNELVQSLRP